MAVQSINSLTNYTLQKTSHNASARSNQEAPVTLVQLAMTGKGLSNGMRTDQQGKLKGGMCAHRRFCKPMTQEPPTQFTKF